MADSLTFKQKNFCIEYLKDHNGTQAAIRAGYSAHTANEQAARLLAKVSVRAEITRRQERVAEKVELTAEYVLTGIRDQCERCATKNPSAYLKGMELLGKHLKLFTDVSENTIKLPKVQDLDDEQLAALADRLEVASITTGGNA